MIYDKSVAAMRSTLEAASAIGAEGVIFHVGSHLGAGFEAALEQVVPALRDLLELTTEDLWLFLENSAGTGGTIGRSTDELATIHAALDHHPRLGLRLDSCHWYASGLDVNYCGRPGRGGRRPRHARSGSPPTVPARQRHEDSRSART